MSKSVAAPKDQINPLMPMVRTAAEMPRQTGLLENLVAMIKRNFNAPELSGIIDIENTASLVVDKRRYRDWETDRKSTRLNSSHSAKSRMPSSA